MPRCSLALRAYVVTLTGFIHRTQNITLNGTAYRRPLAWAFDKMKTIWVQILLISAIILVPVSFALRVIYGRRWLEWENNLVESLGINSVAYTFAKIVILVCLAGWCVWRERRKRQRRNALTYELPKT